MIIRIASRSILRNARRSTATIAAVAVGAVAMLSFSAFKNQTMIGLQTAIVERAGHLTIFREGYNDFGTANPAAYDIAGYTELLGTLRTDPELSPMINVATPVVALGGIASNFALDTSKTFAGQGILPSDRDKMQRWNEYGLSGGAFQTTGLRDDDSNRGVVGSGLARMLGFCEALGGQDCPRSAGHSAATDADKRDFTALVGSDRELNRTVSTTPRIDLLASTAGGAPNIVQMDIGQATKIGAKELDDSFVRMHIGLAQRLLYGNAEPRATSIDVQLHHTADLPAAIDRIKTLNRTGKLGLEVRDFAELTPSYGQIVGMYTAIFAFISIVIGIVVLFSIVNTMSMTVMERINEIGTSRALGFRRSRIGMQFLAEGVLLGTVGATAGVAIAVALVTTINGLGLSWMPPGATVPTPFRLLLAGQEASVFATWLALVLISVVATVLPAMRAARMTTVDSLRHV
ncbi:FtsX-like permease family protein [Sphingobium sufflavum]|uniref:ABC transporter permease n=1 Tax=Sphingobium sufflavum TaxID=1129547 RepID=UPI001F39793C|nr:FtsX-like permease family protein [Sphingobium sufflavum]MCE7797240.1 FtsX-like permease family protein [Sphingobium sufflavum]